MKIVEDPLRAESRKKCYDIFNSIKVEKFENVVAYFKLKFSHLPFDKSIEDTLKENFDKRHDHPQYDRKGKSRDLDAPEGLVLTESQMAKWQKYPPEYLEEQRRAKKIRQQLEAEKTRSLLEKQQELERQEKLRIIAENEAIRISNIGKNGAPFRYKTFGIGGVEVTKED